MPPSTVATLPTLAQQAATLIGLGVPDLAGLPAARFRDMCPDDPAEHALLAVHPDLLPASALAPLIRCNDKPGFVVADMVELDDFAPIPSVVLPDTPPALWISNGTGRDGTANRNAPKVGWCWAGNRHTWLGFASAARREPLAAVPKLF